MLNTSSLPSNMEVTGDQPNGTTFYGFWVLEVVTIEVRTDKTSMRMSFYFSICTQIINLQQEKSVSVVASQHW